MQAAKGQPSLFDHYEPAYRPPWVCEADIRAGAADHPDAIWFLFAEDRLVCRPLPVDATEPLPAGLDVGVFPLGGIAVPCGRLPEAWLERLAVVHPLGTFLGVPVLAARVDSAEALVAVIRASGFDMDALRALLPAMEVDAGFLAGRTLQIVNWERNNRFCGRCGGAMKARTDERAMECTTCGFRQYPRLSPAIIVAVTRGDALLLAHANHFAPGLFSLVAGFVEPGETFEDCVAREVREEVGIGVGGIRYLASQPWPFPDSLMVGFTAQWAEGAVQADCVEIGEAGWYHRGSLPTIPGPHTIAGRIIRMWEAGEL